MIEKKTIVVAHVVSTYTVLVCFPHLLYVLKEFFTDSRNSNRMNALILYIDACQAPIQTRVGALLLSNELC